MIRYFRKQYNFFKAPEYDQWLSEQTMKSRFQISKRLENIERYGHFGDFREVALPVFELKWPNGRRIYYAHISELDIVLLYGGNKNGQNKDITYAKKIFKKYI